MYPIATLFILGLIIFLVRLVWLLVLGFGGRGARNAVKALANRDLRLATAESQRAHGEVGKVLRSVLGKNFKDRASAEKSLEVLFAGEVPKLEMGLSWISVFASTAPLLGLLGTVMGMIELYARHERPETFGWRYFHRPRDDGSWPYRGYPAPALAHAPREHLGFCPYPHGKDGPCRPQRYLD